MSARVKVYITAAVLVLIGLGMALYKNLVLGFPMFPGNQQAVWTIEAEVNFLASNESVVASLALPSRSPKISILQEDSASSGYGFIEETSGSMRRGVWSKRNARGQQALYYRIQVYENRSIIDVDSANVPVIEYPGFDEPLETAAISLLDQIREISANNRTFTSQLLLALNAEAPGQNVIMLRRQTKSDEDLAVLVAQLLAMEGIAARVISGLRLEDGRRRQQLSYGVEVLDGDDWEYFNLETGITGFPDRFLLWQRGGQALLEVVGGRNSSVQFSIVENYRGTRELPLNANKNEGAALIDFSIYSLPLAEQNAFKSILLVPIGALVVVIMRLLIGVKTSGTFMPILIALAFIQTTLVAGVLIFLTVVGAGLVIRSFLSRLNLLLVARISAVIIVVILIMAIFSIISSKLGIERALTVTFFPMIILAWTIERMSVLWEEDGPREVFKQGAGSLLVAVIAYLCMTNSIIEHLTFNFPELLLALLGLILVLGQYTGYRLSELRRFEPMIEHFEATEKADAGDTKTTS